MEKRLNQTEIATALNKTKGYISRLVKQGIIRLGEDKRAYIKDVEKSIKDNSDPTKSYAKKDGKFTEKKFTEKFTNDEKFTKEEIVNNIKENEDIFKFSYSDARTRNEQIDVLINTIKLEKEKGKLVTIESVSKNSFEIAKKLKEGLLNIPDRLCDMLASEGDPLKVHNALTKEIKEVLEEISQELKKYE